MLNRKYFPRLPADKNSRQKSLSEVSLYTLSMNYQGKQINHHEKYHEESKTRTLQIQRVAWQLEIPGETNNTTENLK